jgi:hypothetical protein
MEEINIFCIKCKNECDLEIYLDDLDCYQFDVYCINCDEYLNYDEWLEFTSL